MDGRSLILKYSDICRLCLTNVDDGDSLYKQSELLGSNNPATFLNNFIAELKIDEADPFPDKICKLCFSAVMSTHSFIEQCLRSDAILRHWCDKNDLAQENDQQFGEFSRKNGRTASDTVEPLSILEVQMKTNHKPGDIVLKYENSRMSQCPYCNKTIKSGHLSQHIRNVHENKVIRCTVCSKSLKESCIGKHLRRHKKDNVLDTKRDVQVTPSVKEDEVKNKDDPVKCDLCGKIYSRKRSVRYHILKHHLQIKNIRKEKRRCVCLYCNKIILKLSLPEHIRSVHETKAVSCNVCGKLLKETLFRKHLIRHEKNFLCSTCGKVFTTKYSLQDHEQLHSGEKPFTCEICGQGFVTKNHYRIHLKNHREQIVYQCEICGKSVRSNDTLKRHKLTHSGTKPFTCSVCQKSFYTFAELKKHSMQHHGGTPEHRCPYCEKAFWYKTQLRIHVMAHKNIRPHECELCERAFLTKMKLQRHLRQVHKTWVAKGERKRCDPKTYIPLDKLLEH